MQGPSGWKVRLYSPAWDMAVLEGRRVAAQVFFDPESRQPGVIETEHGLLWAMAGRGSVRLHGPGKSTA